MTEVVEETPKKRMGRPPLVENPRSYILKISAQFFGKNGYERSTIAQLAKGMNMSKAFIYHYFTSKEQIIDELVLDTYRRLIDGSKARVGKTDDVLENIRLFMLQHAEFIQENYYEVRALDYSFAGQMSKEVEIVARKNNSEYRGIVVDLFKTGIANGSIRSDDPYASAQAVFSLAHSISRWYRPDTDPNPATYYVEKFFDMISVGIQPDR